MRTFLGITFFSFAVFLSLSAHALSPSEELLDITLDRNINHPAMDLDRVKFLVESGADLGARNASSAYPFLLAVETYSYLVSGGQTDKAEAAKQVALYLLSKGSDVSSADGRGMTPAMYLAVYDPKDISTLFDAIVAAKPNFGAVGYQKKTLMHFLPAGNHPRELEIVIAHIKDFGIDLKTVDENGISVFETIAIRATKDASGVLYFQKLLELLSPKDQEKYADLPDHSGNTPLMMAIQARNVDTVTYLLSHFHPDVNRVNSDEETPLGVALAKGNTDIIAKLRAAGAKEPVPPDTSQVSCDKVNVGPFDLSRLMKLVNQCVDSVRSVDGLLSLLPTTLRSHYALMYHSEGLAKNVTTPMQPRPMLYGKDGKLVLAFSDREVKGGNVIELMNFDDKSKQFSFYELTYPEHHKKPYLSDPNPAKCVTCHGLPARPVWNSWSLWTGAYSGEMETPYPGAAGDRNDFREFLHKVHEDSDSRYRVLLPKSSSPVRSALGGYLLGPNSISLFTNIPLDFLTSGLMGERNVTLISQSDKLKPYRYAILGALSCKDPVESYLPTQMADNMPRKFDDLLQEGKNLAIEEQKYRLKLQATIRPGSPAGRYNLEVFKGAVLSVTSTGFNADLTRISSLRYLIEGVQGAGTMAGWFTFFNDNKPSYSTVDVTDLEAHLWSQLLDPTNDSDVYQLYAGVKNKIAIGQIPTWIYRQSLPIQATLCPLLKQKSLMALASGIK